jgi:peroxiredoxin
MSVESLTDADLDGLLGTLEDALPPAAAADQAGATARSLLWSFGRRLQSSRLTPSQETRVLSRFDALASSLPDLAPMFDAPRHIVERLTVGKVAPEIVGRDLSGDEFRLSDYRGKVVVLIFSADWCGICRSLYPYERLLLELYGNWPFAVLGVDGSASIAEAKAAKSAQGLTYRSWWDAVDGGASDGPIASAWHVLGRPAIYVIDGAGVIQFVDLRYEDLLKGVRQMLTDHMNQLDRAGVGHK